MIKLGKEQELQNMEEQDYHALPFNSYSTFKCFIQSFKKYYKKYILKQEVNEKNPQDAEDMRFGSLTDVLKFQPETFQDQYLITSAVVPSGQMLEFINTLMRLVKEQTNDFGVLCKDISLLIKEAYDELARNNKGGKLRDSLEKFQERFLTNKEGWDYFVELKSRGNKTVISSAEFQYANDLVDWINQHPHTRGIFELVTTDKIEVINQLKIIGEINGLEVKGMLDRVHIDHKNKIIDPYDLKVMGASNLFSYNYLKLMYYIQNACYTTLLRQKYPDYQVNPLKFIVIDRYRNYAPKIVVTTEAQYQEAMFGFTTKFGRYYPGLVDTILELKWHIDQNIWDCTRNIFEHGGLEILNTNSFEEE